MNRYYENKANGVVTLIDLDGVVGVRMANGELLLKFAGSNTWEQSGLASEQHVIFIDMWKVWKAPVGLGGSPAQAQQALRI